MAGISFFALQCTLLASCGGEIRLEPPVALSPVPTTQTSVVLLATPTAVVTPRVGKIIWTTSVDPATRAPAEPVSSYLPDAPRIVAAARALSLPAGSRIEATWEYNDTSLDAFTTQVVPADDVDEVWVTFHIDRDPNVPWPVGIYKVAISLNGTPIQEATVEVAGPA